MHQSSTGQQVTHNPALQLSFSVFPPVQSFHVSGKSAELNSEENVQNRKIEHEVLRSQNRLFFFLADH